MLKVSWEINTFFSPSPAQKGKKSGSFIVVQCTPVTNVTVFLYRILIYISCQVDKDFCDLTSFQLPKPINYKMHIYLDGSRH